MTDPAETRWWTLDDRYAVLRRNVGWEVRRMDDYEVVAWKPTFRAAVEAVKAAYRDALPGLGDDAA